MSDLIVVDRLTEANAKTIRDVSNLAVSWELSAAGLLSCDVPLRDLIPIGLNEATLLGKWVKYDHPTAGRWGGQITNVVAEDGIVNISAESWASCLRGVTTDGVLAGGGAGSELGRLIDVYQAITGIRRTANSLQNAGTSGNVQFTSLLSAVGNDIYDSVLPGIVEYYRDALQTQVLQTPGYNVDPIMRVLSLDQSFGNDLTGAGGVRLADRVTNTAGSGWSDDLTDVINRVIVQATASVTTYRRVCKPGKKKKKGKKPKPVCKNVPFTSDQDITKIGVNQASINSYGQRSLQITPPDANWTEATLQSYANSRVNALSRNEQLVTINIARDPTEVGDPAIFSRFREGDIVVVDLSNSGVTGKMMVRHRALDVSSGVMTVSGEAELA